MKNLLEHIHSTTDLKKLSLDELPVLARELREYIIDIVSTKEGHLGASLGVVELTIALHYLFNTPDDKLIWDVGHQAYGHKILTGRKSIFNTNRQLGGISGFPKMKESEFDAFGTGHSSTSISALLGMAISAQLKGLTNRQHIAVIGDASIASGMAFEGLNHAGVTKANILVILNDNAMGIDPSVGALKKYLTNVKTGTAKDENIFECLNFNYTGPIDGHDLNSLILELKRLKQVPGPKLLHLITTKGKGLQKAEENQITYHAPGKFDKKTGELQKKIETPQPPKFQDVFGKTIVELALVNEKIVGITPAMPTGSSLKFMMEEIPDRAFDVGIAEQHAVTMAAGMAADGLVPFCNIYSTFLQRAYDQVIHDVALQKLPVIFCLDRAGLVGEDGPTHHGVFDIGYLRCIPNLIICSPINEIELRNLMFTAQTGLAQPMAIRYPRGRGRLIDWQKPMQKIKIGKGYLLQSGTTVAILSTGPIGNMITDIIHELDYNTKIAHYHFPFIKPLDIELLNTIFKNHEQIITIEDGAQLGGFGTSILELSNSLEINKNMKIFGLPDNFITHGSTQELHKIAGIDKQSVKHYVQQFL